MKFRLNDKQVTLKDMFVLFVVDIVEDEVNSAPIEETLGLESLAVSIMNFGGDNIKEYDNMLSFFIGRCSYTYAPRKLYLDLKNRATPPIHPSIKETSVLELKALPSHLHYPSLGAKNTLLVIFTVDFLDTQVGDVILVL